MVCSDQYFTVLWNIRFIENWNIYNFTKLNFNCIFFLALLWMSSERDSISSQYNFEKWRSSVFDYYDLDSGEESKTYF